MLKVRSVLAGSCGLAAVLFQTSCTPPGGGGTGTPTLPVNPTCTILHVSSLKNNTVDTPSQSTYSPGDASAIGGFTPFATLTGPRGNPPLAGTPDAYGISEAWFRRPGNATVVRAQAHGAPRRAATDALASAWTIRAEDATGSWSGVFSSGSANRGDEMDDSATGARTVPQLMTVGQNNLQMFACAGLRTEDGATRSTWLLEIFPPNNTAGFTGRSAIVQDVLYGDNRFVPNATGGPLIGPANPPSPRVTGPGDQAGNGHADCAMTQLNDDLTSRELHMIVVNQGHLYHSMASAFGPGRNENGLVIANRFSSISQWADVGNALGGNFGNIESATLVASRPTAVSIIFEAESGGRHRLWHAVRLSAAGGSWRPADDVTAASGASLTGLVESWSVAAGMCPSFDNSPTAPDELTYITWNHTSTNFGRVLSTPRTWGPGQTGIYSPLTRIPGILVSPNDPNRQNVAQSVRLFARPFP